MSRQRTKTEIMRHEQYFAKLIEKADKERGKIKGNLYELDYARHYERVKDRELAADTVRLVYEHGTRDIPAGQYFTGNPDTVYGKFERFEAIPNDPDALQFLLQEEKRSREQLTPGDFKVHIAALHDGLIETEARRIVGEMKRRDTPNSPNKTHFMVELSPAFMQLAATKDTDRLFSMLPYKTLSFSKIEGRHGTYALIDKHRAGRAHDADVYADGQRLQRCRAQNAPAAAQPVCAAHLRRDLAAARLRGHLLRLGLAGV